MDWTELWMNKAASTGLVLLFFGAIVWLLRFLYGPGGRFREAHWDGPEVSGAAAFPGSEKPGVFPLCEEWKGELPDPLADHAAALWNQATSFAGRDDATDRLLALKLEHTARVVAHAAALAREMPFSQDPVLERALLLGALYHDVGRFSQIHRFGTFADAASCNHGLLGAQVLRRTGLLHEEPVVVRRLARAAVALHNRPTMPSGAPKSVRLVLAAVRDADKLDIMRIMEQALAPAGRPDPQILLHLEDHPGHWSKPVLQALRQGRPGLYADMRVVNDFRLLLCTWLFDFNFSASLRILAAQGSLERIAAGLEGADEVRAEVLALVRRSLAPFRHA